MSELKGSIRHAVVCCPNVALLKLSLTSYYPENVTSQFFEEIDQAFIEFFSDMEPLDFQND